ncbi:MAG: PKD domain-containing protein, partial [Thermoplasmata archaeon]
MTWSEDFDDGDLNDLYVSYDDTDGGNANDYGNLVEVSTDQYVSGSYSLHIKSLNLNGGSVARAFAHSGYVEDWETLLEYTVSTSFFFPGTDNHWLVVIKTMDVHLVLTGDILGAHSALTGETKDIAQLNVSTWYQIQSNVLKFSGIYEVVINGTSYGWYNATSDSTGPKIVSVGDLGDTLSANSRGEGYWDDLCLDYRELEFGPVAYAGPDRTTKVGDTLDFLGEGAGGFQNNTWERHPFGWDEWIDQWPPGTNLTEYEYNGKIYAGLVAVEYYDGRAVYAPGNALVPSWGSEGVLYQLLVNSVRWVTRWKSPSSTDVLFVWGHEELTTYASASWNGPSAVSSEGYHVEVEELIPSNLSGYDVVVMLSAGWSWGAKISQQGYNNGWCSVTSSGCPKGNAPKQAEINSILSFVSGGGGFIATAEESDGNEYLNGISMPMGVHFLDSPNVAGGFWGNKVVPWHPILSRWEGVRAPIISWLWDFGDGSSQFGGRNASHAYAAPGVYNVTLTIEDSLGLTVSDSCLVHVTLDNQPPVADAGPDQTVNEGDTVQFNGTGSYDPDGGAFGWKVLSNMSFPRMSLAAAAVGQKIYAMGGNLCDEGCGGPVQQVPEHVVSAVEVYDATQNLWYEGVSMPTNRSELAAATVSDKIYAIGGTKGVMVMPMGTLDLNEEYDPVTGEWKSKAGMPTPRAAFGIAVVDGKVFAIGGYHFMPMSFYRALNVTEVYDPITDTWTTRSPMPTSRSFLALAALDRKIYAIGGAEDPRLIEVYDVDTDTWTTATEMPPMPSNRSLRGVSAVALAGRAYVMGGYSYDCVSSGVISYDPKTDQWR